MKYIFPYFTLRIKKSLRSMIFMTVATVLLALVLVLGARVMIRADESDVSRQRIKVGIAGDIEGTHLGIGFATIAQADDLSFSVEFIEMTEEEAEEALRELEISAYVLVPQNYVSSLVRGEDAVLTFVMSKSSADISAILMSEVAQVLSPLVTESESGIYAMMDYGYDMDEDGMSDKVTRLNLKYITEILDRSSALELRTLGIDSLTTAEYYVCGIITFFLLIFSVACCPLFADKNLPMGRLLTSKGMKAWQITLCEYVSYFLMMWATVTVLSLGGAIVCGKVDLGIDPAWVAGLPLSLLPGILMISALHFAIYELTSGIIAGVLAQFAAAVATAYISGCFYPYYMFPQSIQSVSSVLPSGILFGFLRENMAERDCNIWGACLVYTVLLVGVSSLVRNKRLSEETA